MSSLRGRRVIVTGASSGIGAAVAQQLIDAGAEVTALDRNEPTVAVARYIPVDLADPASIDSAVAQLSGSYDALLNVAGVPGTLPGDVVFAVNFLGMRALTEAVVPLLPRGGAVVIVSSTAGNGWPARIAALTELMETTSFEEGAAWFASHPQEGNAYNFSKEAATVYTQGQGIALLERGIRINAVLPGPVETPILGDFEGSMGKDLLDGVRSIVGRHATAQDIAGPVIFLASDESRWVNGHALAVDGGLTGGVLAGRLQLTPPN